MTDIPEDIMKAAESAIAEMCALHDYAGRPAWVNIVAKALFAERNTDNERVMALLKDPVAVRINWIRGDINADGIIADERERCAQIAREFSTIRQVMLEVEYAVNERYGGDATVDEFVPIICDRLAAAIRSPDTAGD